MPAIIMTAMVSPMARAYHQDDARHNAGLGGRHGDKEHAALVAGAKGQGALVIAVGDSPDGAFRHADDGGQDHDAQQHRGGEDALAVVAAEKVLHDGDHHHQAEEAVDDGGDACQKVHGGL